MPGIDAEPSKLKVMDTLLNKQNFVQPSRKSHSKPPGLKHQSVHKVAPSTAHQEMPPNTKYPRPSRHTVT